MDGVTKSYPGGRKCFEDIRLSFLPGVRIGVVGVNGAGKSTLLRIMAGLDRDHSGEAWAADGVTVGYLPQEPELDPNLTVRENVLEGVAGKKATLDRFNDLAMNYSDETADEMARLQDEIDAANLWDLEAQIDVSMEALRCPPDDAAVETLSGGEKRRVALCRLLLERPDMLLLDEPLGALDLGLRRQMQEELVGLQKKLGVTSVHVTHDQEEAMHIADRIVVLNRGRIEDLGSPDRVYLAPTTLFTATFMGESNILAATVSGRRDGLLHLRTPFAEVRMEGRAPNGTTTMHLSVRPEHIRLEPVAGAISFGRVTIRETVFQGAHRRCHAVSMQEGETDLLIRVPAEHPVRSGDRPEVFVRREDLVLLAD